jgi:hypothetical protein
MLAQASTMLSRPPDDVVRVLAVPSHPWSVALAGDGGELLARVGVKVGGLPIYKQVQLHVGVSSATQRMDRIMLPVSWSAAGGPPIFPMMEGTLHIEPEGSECTKLTLNARYDPPFGRLGDLIDRAMMHRVAELTMADFIERLARALDAEIAERSPEP